MIVNKGKNDCMGTSTMIFFSPVGEEEKETP